MDGAAGAELDAHRVCAKRIIIVVSIKITLSLCRVILIYLLRLLAYEKFRHHQSVAIEMTAENGTELPNSLISVITL